MKIEMNHHRLVDNSSAQVESRLVPLDRAATEAMAVGLPTVGQMPRNTAVTRTAVVAVVEGMDPKRLLIDFMIIFEVEWEEGGRETR